MSTTPTPHRFQSGDRVAYPAFGYTGTFVRYERVRGMEYAVVQWAGRPYTARQLPNQIEPRD